MADDAGALRLRPSRGCRRRIGVDDQQLVDERDLLHQLAARRAHDGPDGLRLVEGGQDGRDGQPLLLLELDQALEVGELRVMEARLGEPAPDPGGHAAAGGRGALGGLEGLGLCGTLLEHGARGRLAGPDHDDGRSAPAGRPSRAAPRTAAVRLRCRPTALAPMTTSWAVLGGPQDRGGRHSCPRPASGSRRLAGVLPDEHRQRPLGLRRGRLGRGPAATTWSASTSASKAGPARPRTAAPARRAGRRAPAPGSGGRPRCRAA